MIDALLVFLGGGLGAVARWGAGRLVHARVESAYPWHTLLVNVLGSFLLGVLAGFAAERDVSQRMRLFLAVGVLGGFTTYSSFNLETTLLYDERGALAAGGYVLATVATCLAAGWLGGWVVRTALP